MSEPNPEVPAGFGPIFRSSPLLETLGNFYSRGAGPALEIGLLVDRRHTNARGHLHGGVVATLADVGMGYLLAMGSDPPRRLLTVSLSVDCIASASIGDWVDIRLAGADFTGRLAFASAGVAVGPRVIARARGVYSAATDAA